jgi:hypothetical protein
MAAVCLATAVKTDAMPGNSSNTGFPHLCRRAPFYQEIARATANNRRVQLIAALPQEISNSKQYLSGLNVPINEIRQSTLTALGVKGTPTLILINGKGEVMQSWPGKLSSDKEREVLLKLDSLNSASASTRIPGLPLLSTRQ